MKSPFLALLLSLASSVIKLSEELLEDSSDAGKKIADATLGAAIEAVDLDPASVPSGVRTALGAARAFLAGDTHVGLQLCAKASAEIAEEAKFGKAARE